MAEQEQQPQGKYAKKAAEKSGTGEQIALVVKIVVAGVAIVALGMFLMWGLEEMKVRGAYNDAVSLINQQQYEEAIPVLKELRKGADPEMQARIDSDLALCYVTLSRDLELSIQEQKDLLNQAYELDPGSLDADERRILGK